MVALSQGMAFKIGLMLPPAQNVAMPFTFDFTNQAQYDKDLFQEQSNEKMPYVQSVWIDNSGNSAAFTLAFDGMGFSITVKAGTQGLYPVLQAEGAPTFHGSVAVAGAGKLTKIILLSMPVPYKDWATA